MYGAGLNQVLSQFLQDFNFFPPHLPYYYPLHFDVLMVTSRSYVHKKQVFNLANDSVIGW
jgi:hypothetical protein